MFAIVFTDEEGEMRYWTGGEVFSISPAEAVVFQTEVDAGDTLPLLRRGMEAGLHQSAKVVALPKDEEDQDVD